MSDFKESGAMYAIAAVVILFVIGQSLFFLIRAWKHGKECGLSTQTLKNVVTSSALFTLAPAIAILTTVVVLSSSLGTVLPWIRLTVVGNLQYEVTAAQNAMETFKNSGNAVAFGQDITDPEMFSVVSWVMTLGVILSLFLMPFLLRVIQRKMGKVNLNSGSGDNKFSDIITSAVFIGLISAFVGTSLAGKASVIVKDGVKQASGMGAGVMSVIVLVSSVIFVVILQSLCKKFKWDKFEPFVMPLGMFAAMGMAMLAYAVLPESISMLEWRPAV